MENKKVLTAKRLPGVFPDDFTCELTQEMDKHLKDGLNDIRLGWCTYLYQVDLLDNQGFIAIRFPGATRGHIEVDDNNKVIDVQIYDTAKDSYKDTVKQAVKKFIGYTLVIAEEA